MERVFYDWENDPDLASKAKIVKMPLSSEQKATNAFNALEEGYNYTPKGMLEKEVIYDLANEELEEVYYYDPATVKLDSAGRKYFTTEKGQNIFFDDNGNVYYLCFDLQGNVSEYIPFGDNQLLYFKNPEHTIGITDDGVVYEYDPVQKNFIYSPNLIMFDDIKKAR